MYCGIIWVDRMHNIRGFKFENFKIMKEIGWGSKFDKAATNVRTSMRFARSQENRFEESLKQEFTRYSEYIAIEDEIAKQQQDFKRLGWGQCGVARFLTCLQEGESIQSDVV